jgi:hypothetical protein
MEDYQSHILISMPLYGANGAFEPEKMLAHLQKHWGITATNPEQSEHVFSFEVEGQMMFVSEMNAPIPDNFDTIIEYSYMWKAAKDVVPTHTSHLIVTSLSVEGDFLTRKKRFTKVLASIAATSECLCIYESENMLLISRDMYVSMADVLNDDATPVTLWVYIGFFHDENGINMYTRGLEDFGKLEFEIVGSKEDGNELFQFFNNIIAYAIKYDVNFKDGETLGYTADQKVAIRIAPAAFLEGNTIQLSV